MKQPDWSQPQRQPVAGLVIVFLNTLWEVFKRVWPFLLLMLLGGNGDNNKAKVDRNELLALAVLALTIVGAVFRFIYFRFFIDDEKLVIKSGWLKKETKVIPLQKIQSVSIEQGPLHQALNIVKLSIDTAGSEKAEGKIDALHKSMAEALKKRLAAREDLSFMQEEKTIPPALISLSDKDLLKLSFSANHFETFLLLLSFGFGIYQNANDIDTGLLARIERMLPQKAIYPILFFCIAILLITIVVSTARIFFRFHQFTVTAAGKGYLIKSGLFNVKEKLVAFQKIQFVSWKASWLRRLFQLWMLEYHIARNQDVRKDLKVQLPVTQTNYISTLVNNYFPLPDLKEKVLIRKHPSFILRRFLMVGLIPCLLIIPLLWMVWGINALWVLLYALLILVISWQVQKKFCLWALEDVLYIRKGIFGEEHIIMQWHKLQTVQLTQSMYQRRKGLASLVIYTAGGAIPIHFISLEAARQVINYSLYKTEVLNKQWM